MAKAQVRQPSRESSYESVFISEYHPSQWLISLRGCRRDEPPRCFSVRLTPGHRDILSLLFIPDYTGFRIQDSGFRWQRHTERAVEESSGKRWQDTLVVVKEAETGPNAALSEHEDSHSQGAD